MTEQNQESGKFKLSNERGWQWDIWSEMRGDSSDVYLNTWIPSDEKYGSSEGDYVITFAEFTEILSRVGIANKNWAETLTAASLDDQMTVIEEFETLARKTGRSHWSCSDW